jgi:hypothetical protein
LDLGDSPGMFTRPQNFKTDPNIVAGSASSFGYSWHDDEINYKGFLYLRKHLNLKSTMLSDFHSSTIVGNFGFTKTYEWVKYYFFYDGMKQKIHTIVVDCDTCQ